MSWPMCVTICVGIVSICGMVAFIAWCGMNAIVGKMSENDGFLDELDKEFDKQESEDGGTKPEEPAAE